MTEVVVLAAAGKLSLDFDPTTTDERQIRRALEKAGHPALPVVEETTGSATSSEVSATLFRFFTVAFVVVIGVVIGGEVLGLFDFLDVTIPPIVWILFIGAVGWRILLNVAKSTIHGRITSHLLMTIGMIAAGIVGEWSAAAIVLFFMRAGEYTERMTAEKARQALRELVSLAPRTAQVIRNDEEIEVAVEDVRLGDLVIVRPGEKVPVDGLVLAGRAAVDQSSITGEPMPVEAHEGNHVFAASIIGRGSLTIRTTAVGQDTTFGRIVKLVEEAETRRSGFQQFADRFSGWYMPIVLIIAISTFILTGNPLATAAVLVVVCSCSIALATPVAMLASIGSAAKKGILIKGGKYIEALAKADVLLLDKTGTLTLGRPQITDVVTFDGWRKEDVLFLAASVEKKSEHPLAGAVQEAAAEAGVGPAAEATSFTATPGVGVSGHVGAKHIEIGSREALSTHPVPVEANKLAKTGKTLLYVQVDGRLAAIFAASDVVRSEVPEAVERLRSLGIKHIEILTGDEPAAARPLAESLKVNFRAKLLPEQKIEVVQQYQREGKTVVMIGDGVNDAPALAQADVGIAMGVAGTDVAIEAAHVALMRDDWRLVPEAYVIARRTMAVVRGNLVFTGVYNIVGMLLAATGHLPVPLAAAMQSLPDLGILGNSARLLRSR